jgi:hypothetical protein
MESMHKETSNSMGVSVCLNLETAWDFFGVESLRFQNEQYASYVQWMQ